MVAGRPLRIGLDAHVVGRRKTGNETYAIGLAAALAARTDVDLTTFLDRGAPWPRSDATPGSLVRLPARARVRRLLVDLPRLARDAELDVLHVQYVGPPLVRTRLAVAVHDVSYLDRPELFARPARLRLRATIAPSVRRADVVLALSAFTRERLLHHYDLDPARVLVVPAGIDLEGIRRAWTTSAARVDGRPAAETLGIRSPFVLHVGDRIPRKNLPRLVRAVAAARSETGLDVGLVLAGQAGRDDDEIAAAIDATRGTTARPWVHLPGYVDRSTLEGLYREATVVAQPSLYEGFGLPVLEAMARGAVVVTSRTTALPEVVGDAAVLADPEDTADLGHAIARALTDRALRERLVGAGPIRAASFTWDRAAAAAVDAYDAALRR